MHIIIDFDYTLFNTDALRQKLLHTLEPFSVKEIEYRFAERELKVKHLYNIDHHLNMLIHGTAREQAGKIVDDALNHCADCLYADALPFLQEAKKQRAQLTLLSFGNKQWQKRKIDGSGIASYFDEIVLVDTAKQKVLPHLKYIGNHDIIINDRGIEIDKMKQIFPNSKAIWLRREGSAHKNEKCLFFDKETTSLLFQELIH